MTTNYTYGRTTGDHIRPGFELRRLTDLPDHRQRTDIIGLGMTAAEAEICAQALNAHAVSRTDLQRSPEDLAEAKALGAILPFRWTPEQRDRVIALTGWSAERVDDLIGMSRLMNGL